MIKNYLKSGEVFIWLTGMGLALSIIMISGLLLLIVMNGKNYFWANELVQVNRIDGSKQLGELVKED